jgi:uncharacterized RDD family membrane protein YckC
MSSKERISNPPSYQVRPEISCKTTCLSKKVGKSAQKNKIFRANNGIHMVVLDQPQVPQQMVYASFGERLVARLIDALILFIPSMFIPFLVPWLYFALQEGGSTGATVGKRAMGIRVVSTEGNPIGFGTATGRFFGNLLNLFTLLIGYLLMLFNARNQCLHDMITSTVVIKENSYGAQAPAPIQRSNKRNWSNKLSDTERHFVEITPNGGRHCYQTDQGETVTDFTLWQLTDGMVNFAPEFGPEKAQEMKQYAEQLLRNQA